jgi:hypothetical protein
VIRRKQLICDTVRQIAKLLGTTRRKEVEGDARLDKAYYDVKRVGQRLLKPGIPVISCKPGKSKCVKRRWALLTNQNPLQLFRVLWSKPVITVVEINEGIFPAFEIIPDTL